MTAIENFSLSDAPGSQSALWQGENHPLAAPRIETADLPTGATAVDAPTEMPATASDAPTELPAPVQQAIDTGAPIRFSTAADNAEAKVEPDYFLTPEGTLVANPKATPNPDGGINIEMQAKEAAHKSLAQAIENRTEAQKAFAEELIRHFQKKHPGQSVPGWMESLRNAKPNIPDFVPQPAREQAPATPPPENGFSNRGVNPRSGRAGTSGYAGNGGFDSRGYFKGNGTRGDGVMRTGNYDGQGKPLGDGQIVQAKQIYDYMTERHGLTPAQASGILGNMQTESAFNTAAYNPGEGAVGLIQWRGDRRVALESFANEQGKPVTDWKVQVDFMMHELQGSESGAWAKIQQATTPSEVAAAFDKYYERSSGHARGERMANADNIYNTIARTA